MEGAHKSSLKYSFLIPSAIAVLCYINILPNEFCFDDVPIVRDNPKIQESGQWGAIWTTDYWAHSGQDIAHRDLLYRPAALSLLRLTRITIGNHPVAFHIISVILHALCTLLLVLFARTVLSGSTEKVEAAAWLAGAIFAVLPIHSEVVASVVGQADLLATAGTVGALLCHFRVATSGSISQAAMWMVLSAACAFLAMCAKESGICVVPLVFLAVLLGLASDGYSPFKRLTKASYLLIPLAAYLALRFGALGALHQAPAPTKTVNVLVDAPAWQHILGVMQAWGMYWRKTLFPRELAIEYAINAVRLPTSIWQADVVGGFAWIVGLVILAIHGWRQNQKAVPFLVFAILISYLPTSNAFVLIQVFFAERIWYLPSAFVAGLFAVYGLPLLDRTIWKRVGVLLLCVMMVRCWMRNREWKDNGTLFAAAYADHPKSVLARHLYGQWLTQHGELEQGIELIQKALEIDLGFTDAHRSLGRAFLKAGRWEDALREWQIADMQAPGDPQTKAALAEAARAMETQAASKLAELRRNAGEHRQDVEAQLELVRLLRSIGRVPDALELLENGNDAFGSRADWLAEWAITLVYLDRRDDAIEKYGQAIARSPENGQLMVELAMLLIERRGAGDVARAHALTEKAVAGTPRAANVHAAMAEILAIEGDIARGRQELRTAIQLAPAGSEYQRMLIEREKSLGQ